MLRQTVAEYHAHIHFAPTEPEAITTHLLQKVKGHFVVMTSSYIIPSHTNHNPKQLCSTQGLRLLEQHTWNKHPISSSDTEAGGSLTANQDTVFPLAPPRESPINTWCSQKSGCSCLSHACHSSRRLVARRWITVSDGLISRGPAGKLFRAGPSDPEQRR